jgi:hypothetical protein
MDVAAIEEKIYVASRASVPERSEMWRKFRAEGWPIISSWIDEAGEGETADYSELWTRIHGELMKSRRLIFYAETRDFPLKGAFVEVGIALGMRIPVCVVLPGVVLEGRTDRPIGSWIRHPGVFLFETVQEALEITEEQLRLRVKKF